MGGVSCLDPSPENFSSSNGKATVVAKTAHPAGPKPAKTPAPPAPATAPAPAAPAIPAVLPAVATVVAAPAPPATVPPTVALVIPAAPPLKILAPEDKLEDKFGLITPVVPVVTLVLAIEPTPGFDVIPSLSVPPSVIDGFGTPQRLTKP